MKPNQKHTSPEAAEREKRHQFGQPEGNQRGEQAAARSQREFYKWVESEATREELETYQRDKSKPFVRRRFIEIFMQAKEVNDFCQITNQTHGFPKQTLQTLPEPPKIEIILTGGN